MVSAKRTQCENITTEVVIRRLCFTIYKRHRINLFCGVFDALKGDKNALNFHILQGSYHRLPTYVVENIIYRTFEKFRHTFKALPVEGTYLLASYLLSGYSSFHHAASSFSHFANQA